MRNFDWIFNAEGKVATGKECVFDHEPTHYFYFQTPEKQVVTLGGSRPYYTDGTPDPKNDEVNEWNYIELNEAPAGDPQQPLTRLFEILDAEEKEVLYNGRMYKVRGKYYNCYEDQTYFILIKNDSEYLFAEDYEINEYCSPYDLNKEDTKTLFKEVIRNSIYLSDYANSVGCTWSEASSFCDGYYEWLYEEYGDDTEGHDNLESWLRYAGF